MMTHTEKSLLNFVDLNKIIITLFQLDLNQRDSENICLCARLTHYP